MARKLAVAPRYVNRLLEETGTTFSERVLSARLGRVWRLLADSNGRNLKIASIAYDAGFNDLSAFNRTFRRRFGETPTAVRGGRPESVAGGRSDHVAAVG